MQLTRAADYAVRVMLHLAGQPEGVIISKTILANAADVPESFASKILQTLARAGLIQARRGVAGGFTLLPLGRQASLLDVVECIDGPIALNVCLTSGQSCDRHPECAAHRVWLQAQSAMLAVLREAKLAEMVPAERVRPTLLDADVLTGSGKQELDQVRPQGKLLRRGSARRTLPAGARVRRKTGSSKNKRLS